MQHIHWNDLRILLAVQRGQSLNSAAALLGVNATTVSRRLKLLEREAQTPLILRDAYGRLRLSDTGQAMAREAEAMERHAQAADALAGHTGVIAGTVRLTAVPFLLNRLLAPALGALTTAHPDLTISLLSDSRNLSLTRREVDLAIRFAKPTEGGNAVLARRIGHVSFGVFTAAGFSDHPISARPWLTYDPLATHLPQAQWSADLASRSGQAASGLLIHDLETALELVPHHPVRALLPSALARRDPRLVQVDCAQAEATWRREVWALRHKETQGLRRVEAVSDCLANAALLRTVSPEAQAR